VSSDAHAVLEANERFYAVFRERDVAGMDALWSRGDAVAVIHPGWPAVHGRDAVLETWRNILEGPGSPAITCANPRAHVAGELAFVICSECLPEGELVATNIFAREEGRWKLVHHQAGPAPPPEPMDEPGTVH